MSTDSFTTSYSSGFRSSTPYFAIGANVKRSHSSSDHGIAEYQKRSVKLTEPTVLKTIKQQVLQLQDQLIKAQSIIIQQSKSLQLAKEKNRHLKNRLHQSETESKQCLQQLYLQQQSLIKENVDANSQICHLKQLNTEANQMLLSYSNALTNMKGSIKSIGQEVARHSARKCQCGLLSPKSQTK